MNSKVLFCVLLFAFGSSAIYTFKQTCDPVFDGVFSCNYPVTFNWEEPAVGARHSGPYSEAIPFDIFTGVQWLPAGTSMGMNGDSCTRTYTANSYSGMCPALSYITYGSGDYIASETRGTAPNRRYIVTYFATASGNQRHEVQMKFFETSGNVEWHMKELHHNGDYVFAGLDDSAGGDYYGLPIIYGSSNYQYSNAAWGAYHGAPPQTNVCGNLVVEANEQCDGGVCCNSDCTFTSSSTTCRAAAGDCDIAETCSGSSSSCPADTLKNAGTSCQEDFGVCDLKLARTCNGQQADCSGAPIPALQSGSINWKAYNVLSFGDMSGQTGSIGGRAAAKNDVSLGEGFSIGSEVTFDTVIELVPGSVSNIPNRFALVGGHNVAWAQGTLDPSQANGFPRTEGIFAGDSMTGAEELVSRVTANISTEGSLDNDFVAAQAYYRSLSANLAAEPDTVTVTYQDSGVFFNCSGPATRYVASVDAAAMSQATWMSVEPSCSYGASWVINVVGTDDVTFTGGEFPGIGERIIYNIGGSGRNVNVASALVNGNILAVDNNYVQTGGVTAGLVIVNSIIQIASAKNPNCADFEPFDIVVIAAPQASLANAVNSNQIHVYSFSQIIVGDVCTVGSDTTQYTVQERIVDGDESYIRVTPALTRTINGGDKVTCNVANPNAPRPQDTITTVKSEPSSAVVMVISALLVVLALLF